FGGDPGEGLVPGWLPPWTQLALPVVTLAALPGAYLARVTRASLLEVLGQDYIRTARAKGLPGGAILYRHSLRNAAIPVLTLFGPMAAALLTGSFVVEQLFSVPGSGRSDGARAGPAAASIAVVAATPEPAPPAGFWTQAWRRLLRNRLAVAGL